MPKESAAYQMKDAFSGILGQPQVRDYLRQSLITDHVSQAYLFTGPAGSNKTQAAFAFAQALLCPKGPSGPRGSICGECENCMRAKKRIHPDVHFYQPEGARGYLVEQVREIISDAMLSPIQANKKVYIIDRADLLGTSAANAFLKTLEEPPENVVMILLGRTRESVLPTIASRCQIVPFRHIPPSEAAGIIAQNTGASIELSRQAMEAASGSISKAISALRTHGNSRMLFRSEVLARMREIPEADVWGIVSMTRDLLSEMQAPLDSASASDARQLEEESDFFSKSAIRQVEARNKRKLASNTAELLKQAFAVCESWLRDVCAICAGCPDLVINTDAMGDIESAAAKTTHAKAAKALMRMEAATKLLDYNVSPELSLNAVLMEMKEAF